MLTVRVLLLVASSTLLRPCSRRRLSVLKPLTFRFLISVALVIQSPFLSPFLLKERKETPLGSLTACTEKKRYLPWGLEFNWINVAQARFGEASISSFFSKWDEDKLLDLYAGTSSSGIQASATSGLCMGQHFSESSLLFSFLSPLQLVLHSRYKQEYQTKFSGRVFWCIGRENGSLSDCRHHKSWD